MKKWLFLFALCANILPYHGVVTLQLPAQDLRHMCDGPCSPVHQFIETPCREESCLARPERVQEQSCAPLQSPRHETAPTNNIPHVPFLCAPSLLRVAPQIPPHIEQTLLTTQKKE